MKINKIHFHHLRNGEHFFFHTEFKNLVEENGAEVLKIKPQFDLFLSLYKQEDEVAVTIRKSILTADLVQVDRRRNKTFRGLADICRAMLHHFRPEVLLAAKRLKILFDTYGNLSRASTLGKSAAIYNLLQELNGSYNADVQTVGVAEWVAELEVNNKEYENLTMKRFDEATMRSKLVLRKVRQQVDEAYLTITKIIEAQFLLETNEIHRMFIRKLNIIIEECVNNMKRKRHHHSEKTTTDSEHGEE